MAKIGTYEHRGTIFAQKNLSEKSVRALPQGTSELQQGPALRTAVLSFQRNFTCGDLQCAALLPSPFCHSKSPLVHLQLKLPLLWECQKVADASKYLTNR